MIDIDAQNISLDVNNPTHAPPYSIASLPYSIIGQNKSDDAPILSNDALSFFDDAPIFFIVEENKSDDALILSNDGLILSDDGENSLFHGLFRCKRGKMLKFRVAYHKINGICVIKKIPFINNLNH